jgi:dsRNA-specific ribonuclease
MPETVVAKCALQELSHKWGLGPVVYEYISHGPQHAVVYTCTVSMTDDSGETVSVSADGPSKKAASENAADTLFRELYS